MPHKKYRGPLAKPLAPKKVRKRIPCLTSEKAAQRRIYNARVKVWIVGKPCAVYRVIPATQCHHQRGKLGDLLLDERFWIPVSAGGHARIDSNREWARHTFAFLQDGRALMLLCAKGQFNTMPRE